MKYLLILSILTCIVVIEGNNNLKSYDYDQNNTPKCHPIKYKKGKRLHIYHDKSCNNYKPSRHTCKNGLGCAS